MLVNNQHQTSPSRKASISEWRWRHLVIAHENQYTPIGNALFHNIKQAKKIMDSHSEAHHSHHPIDCFLFQSLHFPKLHEKLIYNFLRNFADSQTDKLTNKQTKTKTKPAWWN